MADDPDNWLLDPWVYEVEREKWREQAKQEAEEHKKQLEETRRRRAAGEDAQWELRKARWEEFKDNPKLRKWAMWREYKAGGTTLKKVGENFGITQERVRQSNAKCDRMIRDTLNRAKPGVPANAEVIEATRGVEFVFCNGSTLKDTKGWQQLELTLHDTSAYKNPVPWWKPEWGHQDTSPAKPIPAYTFYKVIIPKEQTDED
jgi:hypothetical protein